MNSSFLGHHAVDTLNSEEKKKRKKGEKTLPLVSDKPIRSTRDQEQSAAISLQTHKWPRTLHHLPNQKENVIFTFRVHSLCSVHPVHK